MATDPKDNKEAKDEKPKEDLTEEQLKDVAGGRQASVESKEEGWSGPGTSRKTTRGSLG